MISDDPVQLKLYEEHEAVVARRGFVAAVSGAGFARNTSIKGPSRCS